MGEKKTGRDNDKPANLGRRQFIAGVAAVTVGGFGLTGCDDGGALLPDEATTSTPPALPPPQQSGIDHVVVVMLENRSFDHYLGWVPGAEGAPPGTVLKDSTGTEHAPFDLAPMYQSCNLADPDHSYAGGRIEINDGAMDGFLLTQPVGDQFPIGYYTADALPFFKGCAAHWTICDRYFCSMLSSTTPNRIYMHAGQTDRKENGVDESTLPTVWDRMQGTGHSVAYYYVDVAYTAFWGRKYNSFSKPFDIKTFANDVNAGKLANLTYVDNVGSTLNEYGGLSRDDHPVADVRDGQAFLNSVYDVLRQGPNWDRTLIIVNYDEWGGFYDHVPPPFAPVTEQEFAATGNDGRLGCRVPCVLIGPRARRGHVAHQQFDPNSILNMLAWRFGFEPLGARVDSTNIAHALDFDNPPNLDAPAFDVPAGSFGALCVPLATLLDIAGVPLPTPLPELPVLPLPLQLQLPPVPGLDVPLQRLLAHQQELQELRQLGRANGF